MTKLLTRFLVFNRGGGVKNFLKKEKAKQFAKLLRQKNFKGVGIEKTKSQKVDNTILFRSLRMRSIMLKRQPMKRQTTRRRIMR